MANFPHERALVKRLKNRPFVLLGINSDRDLEYALAQDRRHRVAWRSWWDPKNGIAKRWNILAWPTMFLIDHEGVIRHRWNGRPDEKRLDAAIEALVKKAEAARKSR